MEKRLPLILVFLLFSAAMLFADPDDIAFIRIRLWAPFDEVPSLDNVSTGQTDYSKEITFKHASDLLRETGNFVINAMVYGWSFSITPKDNTRGVKEYVEFTPQKETNVGDFDIKWSNTVFEEDKITCWLEFERTPLMMHSKSWWNTVSCPRIHGSGESVYTGKFDSAYDYGSYGTCYLRSGVVPE